jgi:hypothetical protein
VISYTTKAFPVSRPLGSDGPLYQSPNLSGFGQNENELSLIPRNQQVVPGQR